MKLTDLFKSKINATEKESESVESSQEERKIFEESESFTNVLEEIDEQEVSEVQTRDLESISSDIDSFLEDKDSVDSEEIENNDSEILEESTESEIDDLSPQVESEEPEPRAHRERVSLFDMHPDETEVKAIEIDEASGESIDTENEEVESLEAYEEPLVKPAEVNEEESGEKSLEELLDEGQKPLEVSTPEEVTEDSELEVTDVADDIDLDKTLKEPIPTFDTSTDETVEAQKVEEPAASEAAEDYTTVQESEPEIRRFEFFDFEETIPEEKIEVVDVEEKIETVVVSEPQEVEIDERIEELYNNRLYYLRQIDREPEVILESEVTVTEDQVTGGETVEVKETAFDLGTGRYYQDEIEASTLVVESLEEPEAEPQEPVISEVEAVDVQESTEEEAPNLTEEEPQVLNLPEPQEEVKFEDVFERLPDETREISTQEETEKPETVESLSEETEVKESQEVAESSNEESEVKEPQEKPKKLSFFERLKELKNRKKKLTQENKPKEYPNRVETEEKTEELLAKVNPNLTPSEESQESTEPLLAKVEPKETETTQETEAKETEEVKQEEVKEEKKPRISVSSIFKRRRKKEEEIQMTAPLDDIVSEIEVKPLMPPVQEPEKEPEIEGRGPHRRKRSELLLSNTLKPKEVETTIEFNKLELEKLRPEVTSEALNSPTKRFEIPKKEPEEVKSSTKDLLKELEARPILEESLKKELEQERKEQQPQSTANTRRKEVQRQLRRQQKRERERQEHETKEMTQNLSASPQTEKALIFANVPDNILKGGILLFNNLARQMDNAGSLRIESLMSVLGSLAGYSIQAGIREKMVNRLRISEDQVFSIIETKNGDRYYFGDPVDRLMQNDRSSLWYMVASATQRLTGKVDIKIEDTMRHTIRTIGKESFGIPRLPKNHRPNHIPKYYVEHMWEALTPGLERFTDDPLQWPLVFSVALQRALICTKNILDPNTSLRIIVESAVPMSIAEIEPIPTSEIKNEDKAKMDSDILREQIETIRKALEADITPEQRNVLIKELSLKTERLYDNLIKSQPSKNAPKERV